MRMFRWFILLLLPMALSAQQKFFLYIQGENQQPFYIKMEGVIFSSSASGFIILPRLGSGSVDLIIGFPKSQWPEQSFSIEMKSTDRGLILKNNQNKGWELHDLQSQQIFEGIQLQVKNTNSDTDKKKTDDPFASSLSAAIRDPGIKDVDLITAKSEISKKTTTAAVAPVQPVAKETKDSLVVSLPNSTMPTANPKIDEKPVAVAPAEKPFMNLVEKIQEQRSSNAIGLLFLDRNGTQIDTIDVTIEAIFKEEKEISFMPTQGKDSTVVNKNITIKVSDSVEVVKTTTTPPQVIKPNQDSSIEVNYKETAAILLPMRKDCKQVAAEKDMIAARKKAYTLGTDSEIILHYAKEVKTKCYSVDLLQALSYAFVQDSSKFQFFQEAYPWVMDPASYPQLERLFVSKEYVLKFKQLINAE